MKKTQTLAILFCLLLFALPLLAQPRVLIVRHSEKLPDWPRGEFNHFQPLSEAGIATSHELARWLQARSIRIDTVLSSATTRTLHTGFILARSQNVGLGIERALQDTSRIEAFLKELERNFDDESTILLVSHSNIIPYLLLKAGLPDSCRQRLGITQPRPDFWLLIEGYDSIWEIPKLKAGSAGCKTVQRYFFREPTTSADGEKH